MGVETALEKWVQMFSQHFAHGQHHVVLDRASSRPSALLTRAAAAAPFHPQTSNVARHKHKHLDAMEADWNEATRITVPSNSNAPLSQPTTFAFDNLQELLWTGNEYVSRLGIYLDSFLGPSLT